ncbi:S-methyl-5-thioribose-1-phosphate isomerase [Neorhodopirellula pilleata]|uniref:Methylthioribose-1-phosphate isomerase n=1 Tax=Neorhodopirellula pilleata TaxID=2714738 RepID=A0A5C6A5R6_9BACT|nr:S-methyl-5-thioribose-1-phosphate isomerase [Neorhodopirellula pilleata]TWT93683.1 Methylthioribose-1-phosphate isomerase [Neorhodopirellula pilleata]
MGSDTTASVNSTSIADASSETIRYRIADRAQCAAVDLLDQTRLPESLTRCVCETLPQLHDAIRRLVVRGAPAIGIAAAYGVTLTPIESSDSLETARTKWIDAIEYLATSRPTAVNLFWALDRMRAIVESPESVSPELESMEATAKGASSVESLRVSLVAEAIRIHEDDRAMCRSIGRHGSGRLAECRNVLTHCNAGGLATSTFGTALAPIYYLHEHGKTLHVYADETRPLLQGARLTAWELAQAGVPVTVITDSMAGGLMRQGHVDAIIVGADRIAANGDAANKIGTYPLAVLAHYHRIPFYVAAPTNTFDLALASGDLIPIEQRDGEEVRCPGGPSGRTMVPENVDVINPAFDVTPAELITAIITERGVIESPNVDKIAAHCGSPIANEVG